MILDARLHELLYSNVRSKPLTELISLFGGTSLSAPFHYKLKPVG